ncbi:MAG: DUF4340 domain-containing protein [Planctomycetes bacterium]|nr:DUF4340 domain-containing protein [Planctomycetota bacterium]
MNLARANVLLLAAATVLAVPTWLQLRGDGDSFTDVASIPLLFDGFTAENVGFVLLRQPKKEQPPADPRNPDQKKQVAYDQVLLQRTDKGFQIAAMSGDRAGVPINKDRVENDVFLHLRTIRIDRETLVQSAATPEQLAQYGLDEEHAFLIKASDMQGKNVVAELYVGKDVGVGGGTDTLRGTYVRKADSSDVILYENDRPWRRDVAEEGWVDRTLARLEPEKIRRLSIRNTATAGTTFTFERPDGKSFWEPKDPPVDVGALRQSEIESFVQRLRLLSVQEYRVQLQRAGDLKTFGLQPPAIEMAIVVRDGANERTITLAVGAKVDGKNEYYLQSSESAFLMTWPQAFVTQFELDVKKTMFDPKAPHEMPPETPKDK